MIFIYATDIRVQREEAKEEGREEGRKENSREIAIRMHENGIPDEITSKITGFPIDFLKKLWHR